MAQRPRTPVNCFKHNGKLFIYNKESDSWISSTKHFFAIKGGKFFVSWEHPVSLDIKTFTDRILVKALNRAEEWGRCPVDDWGNTLDNGYPRE